MCNVGDLILVAFALRFAGWAEGAVNRALTSGATAGIKMKLYSQSNQRLCHPFRRALVESKVCVGNLWDTGDTAS